MTANVFAQLFDAAVTQLHVFLQRRHDDLIQFATQLSAQSLCFVLSEIAQRFACLAGRFAGALRVVFANQLQ